MACGFFWQFTSEGGQLVHITAQNEIEVKKMELVVSATLSFASLCQMDSCLNITASCHVFSNIVGSCGVPIRFRIYNMVCASDVGSWKPREDLYTEVGK